MINKDFMDIILSADGGRLGANLYEKVQLEHNNSYGLVLSSFFSAMNERLPINEYVDMMDSLNANYSNYVEEGYKLGFNDGMRFLISILAG